MSGRESATNDDVDPDIYKEYECQKKYLESSVNTLKHRLDVEQQVHKISHLAIME